MEVLIGIANPGNDPLRTYFKMKYRKSIERAGGKMVVLEADPSRAAEYVSSCDAILIPGGPDVDPSLYGEEREEKCGRANPARDAFEPVLIRTAVEAGRPLLCVCRGIQILNAVYGGTLVQNLAGEKKKLHMSRIRDMANHVHGVSVREGSLLSAITGKDRMGVNSLHHQAVKDVGRGLSVSAVSEDGLVEGLEIDGYGRCIAVQWHPEHLAARDPVQRKIFEAFVGMAREGRSR